MGARYAPEECRSCQGTGNIGDIFTGGTLHRRAVCEACGGEGSVLVAQPARICATCRGTGGFGGVMYCEACGGTGWANAIHGSNRADTGEAESYSLFGSENEASEDEGDRAAGLVDETELSDFLQYLRRSERETPEPLKILKLRYAKGEITREQYEQMKKDLAE